MENTIDKIVVSDYCPGAMVDVEIELFREGEDGKPELFMEEVALSIPNLSQSDLIFDMFIKKDFSQLKKYIFKNFISFPQSGKKRKYDEISKDEAMRFIEFGANVTTP